MSTYQKKKTSLSLNTLWSSAGQKLVSFEEPKVHKVMATVIAEVGHLFAVELFS